MLQAQAAEKQLSIKNLDLLYQNYGANFARDSVGKFFKEYIHNNDSISANFLDDVIEKLSNYDPNNIILENVLFNFFLKNKNYDKARSFIEDIIEIQPSEVGNYSSNKIYI